MSRAAGQPEAGWAYYLRCWRPGKPHPDKWTGHWRAAVEAVAEAPPLVAGIAAA